MKGKVFFVGSYAESLINFRLHLMQALVAEGYEVVALAPHDDAVKAALEKYHIRFIDISLERNGTNPLKDIQLFLNLRKLYRLEKPDIVFSYTIKPVVYASLAARSAGVPKIYALMTGTGYAFDHQGLKNRIVGWMAQKLLKHALATSSKVFFQNPDNHAFFIKKNIIKKSKPAMVVNGSGVDCQFFTPTRYPEEISFLMICRLLSVKGVREYVKAAALLKKTYPKVKCRLVGWIDSNPLSISQNELENWIKNGDIEYLGKLSDVRKSIADSSVYVLPSWNEGMPRTVLEAMAMARPIITTDIPGCRETVLPNRNGFLVPPKNVEALGKAMEYFVQCPEKVSEMGKASREMALEKYDVHKVNHSMLFGMGIKNSTIGCNALMP